MTLLIDLDSVDYGTATESIKRLLQMAAQIDWFPVSPIDQQQRQVETLMESHFDAVRRIVRGALTTDVKIRFIDHDWQHLLGVYDALKYRNDLPAWQGLMQPVLKNAVAEAMRDESMRRLIGPPIWHWHEEPRIVNPLIGDRNSIPSHVPEKYRQTAWGLVCDVDSVLHDAIAWEMFCPDRDNPFRPLLSSFCAQGFPLGFDQQGVFWVFLG